MPTNASPDARRMIPIAGHPGIYRRGSRYVVKFSDRGRERKRSCRTLTEAKAFKAQVAGGHARATSAQPFRGYALGWLTTYTGRTSRGVSDSTRESYAYAITTFAIPYFGTTRLDHIDPPKLRGYVAHLADLGLSAATVRRYFAPLRALLATAFEDGLLAAPVNVRVVVPEQQRPVRRRHLTAAETQALLAEIPPEHADLVLLLATTGARISEALTAVYGGIGQDADGRPELRFARSKTAAGLAPVPLTPDTARMLTRRRAATGAGDAELIFPSAAGSVLDRRAWTRRVFKPAAERAGVPFASPHMLRHGVATLMAERGFQAHDIARTLRHADGGRLAQATYMHPRAAGVEFLDDVLRRD